MWIFYLLIFYVVNIILLNIIYITVLIISAAYELQLWGVCDTDGFCSNFFKHWNNGQFNEPVFTEITAVISSFYSCNFDISQL